MKALIPYAVFGVVGVGGTLAGSLSLPSGGRLPAPTPAPAVATATASDGNVIVHTALERSKLQARGTDTFLRVALEGKRPNTTDTRRVPVALTLVLDRSGSMSGPKIEDAKRSALAALEALQPGDSVALVFFDSAAEDIGTADIGVADGRLEHLRARLTSLYPGGGTNMSDGLRIGALRADRIHKPGAINRVLLLSDGHPDTQDGLRDQVAMLARRGISTTTLGLGADYNEDLMASLADAGLGHYYFVDKPEVLAGIFAEELRSLATIVARESMIELSAAHDVEIVEVIGFESRREGARTFIPTGDIYGGRTTDVLVKLRVGPHYAAPDQELVRASVRFFDVAAKRPEAVDRRVAASFVFDEAESAASLVPAVAVKAEKWRTAQSYARANDAYNRGDFAGGDVILREQQARLVTQSAALGSDELKEEAAQVDSYQKQNAQAGTAGRAVTSKLAKKKAWSLNKGTGY